MERFLKLQIFLQDKSDTGEDKGIITSLTEEGKNRRYEYKNIKKMLLIKELLDEGYTLDASAEKVKKRIEMIEATFNKIKKLTGNNK